MDSYSVMYTATGLYSREASGVITVVSTATEPQAQLSLQPACLLSCAEKNVLRLNIFHFISTEQEHTHTIGSRWPTVSFAYL